jgi:hypothetical protein
LVTGEIDDVYVYQDFKADLSGQKQVRYHAWTIVHARVYCVWELKLLTMSLLVHVVKGRQYSAYTVTHAGPSIAEMESETDSRPR